MLIVIDEFATLAKQLPEFVAGVVDIAQRGRSLGIHLVLSTQRLSGAVDENIVANANVRVALRLLDRADSAAMIGSDEAAEIPVASRGRASCESDPTGSSRSRRLRGATVRAAGEQQPIACPTSTTTSTSHRTTPSAEPLRRPSPTQPTELVAILERRRPLPPAGLPAPRRPWRDALPAVVMLDVDDTRLGGGRFVVIGTLDVPEQQAQGRLIVDLEDGGCLIFGSAGSGKTTLLRSVAASACTTSTTEQLAILVLDCASNELADARRPRPRCRCRDGRRSRGDQPPRGDARSRARAAPPQPRRRTAEHLTAYNAGNPPLARIVVLIDDIGSLVETLGECATPIAAAGETWAERLVRVLIDGRHVGIHGVVTADRRSAIPARLHGAVSNRIVLGHADRLAYADHGVPRPCPLAPLSPGPWVVEGSTVIQVASCRRSLGARPARGDSAARPIDRTPVARGGVAVPLARLGDDPSTGSAPRWSRSGSRT